VVSLLIDGEWIEATRGCYAVIPGGIQHDFDFEQGMPDIVK